MDAHRLKRRPFARAFNANAVFHPKPRAMGGADQQLSSLVQKLVGERLKRRAAMRTAVHIGENLTPPSQKNEIERAGTLAQLETFCPSIRDVCERAEERSSLHDNLNAEPADDGAHDNKHNEKVAAVDECENQLLTLKCVIDGHGRHNKSSPNEKTGQNPVTYGDLPLAKMTNDTCQNKGHDE